MGNISSVPATTVIGHVQPPVSINREIMRKIYVNLIDKNENFNRKDTINEGPVYITEEDIDKCILSTMEMEAVHSHLENQIFDNEEKIRNTQSIIEKNKNIIRDHENRWKSIFANSNS